MAAIVPEGGWAYGLQLPIQTLTLNLVDPWEDAATVADLVTVAQKAEATGHSFIGVCDHVAVPDNDYAAR
ncbi:MAG: ssuD1, partial [Actinomycetia bacterium]|nr:ssuD1 [Actinomycetes bacterium]